jgi:MFS family permease
MAADAPTAGNKRLVLTAMIFAVAMMFIDQTIVALAIPDLQKDLSLTGTGSQWIINGYLLALSALFAFGGRLADVYAHRRVVVIASSASPPARRCAARRRPARSASG